MSTLRTKNKSRVEHAESIKDGCMAKIFFKLESPTAALAF